MQRPTTPRSKNASNVDQTALKRTDTSAQYDKVHSDISDDDWERLARAMYAYRLGTMTFLEMLSVWEDILGIPHPPIS
jgi:hypothetical protein